ncbi:hypothetical protein QOZ80_4BG0341330 [Eleusine coracana subsp. coracana]|nr:hypothetical protein QOZ80_4BG0341330 [Eleusine coracana subsp. coracana]
MIRHSSLEELNDTEDKIEENERHADRKLRSKQSGNAAYGNGNRSVNRPDQNGWDQEEVAESECSSDSASRYGDGHEEKEEFPYEERSDGMSGNEDHGEGIEVPIDSDEEECVKVRQKVVQVDPKEQEDFDRELKAVLQESLESRKLEPRARPYVHMKIPMNAFEGSKDSAATEAADGENRHDDNGKSGGASKVCVKVLVKKGHKQQMKQMVIPRYCSLVHSTKQLEATAELEEKQNIKRIILEYNEREEEELNRGTLQASDGGEGRSSSITLAGRDCWEGPNRGGGGRQHFYVAGGSYRGYGNRR